jgi:hypothetical protein
MSEPPSGSATKTALDWLDGVVSNTGRPLDDGAIWLLTHESLCCQMAATYPGIADMDARPPDDPRTLDHMREMGRHVVLGLRAALPAAMQDLSIGDSVGLTSLVVAQSPGLVEVIFSDLGLESGWYPVAGGDRVGFALTLAYENERWTVTDIEQNWYWPAWLSELDPTGPKA